MGKSTDRGSRRRGLSGQGLVEYALILALIGAIVIGGALIMSGALSNLMARIGTDVDGAVAGMTATPAPAPTTPPPGGPPDPGAGAGPTPTIDPDQTCASPGHWEFDLDQWAWVCRSP
jgi:Flp pilus assembly pilin Flp